MYNFLEGVTFCFRMNSLQLHDCLKHHGHFLGVFASNTLPIKVYQYPFSLVVNTDPNTEPGEHWLAIFARNRNEVIVFDSFGMQLCNSYIVKFLNRNRLDFDVTAKRYQSYFENTCGNHVVYFIDNQSKNYGITAIDKTYTGNPKANDILVKWYVKLKYKITIQTHKTEPCQTCSAFLP